MEVCGITEVAKRTGAELVSLSTTCPSTCTRSTGPSAFNEFPVPRPVRDADVYIGVPKMKMHVHTTFTCALKLQFGNLPDYDWMTTCHRDDIYPEDRQPDPRRQPQVVHHGLALCLPGQWAVQRVSRRPDQGLQYHLRRSGSGGRGHGVRGADGLGLPGTNAPATVLAASEGLGTNKMEEIELTGAPLDRVKRRFRRPNLAIQGKFPNVNAIMGAACEPGCRSLIIGFDQLYVEGTLDKLKRPLYVFMGLQFPYEDHIKNLDGDVIVLGDCAKTVLERFPNAKFFGSTSEYRALHADLGEYSGHRPGAAREVAGLESGPRRRYIMSYQSPVLTMKPTFGDGAPEHSPSPAPGSLEAAGDQGLRYSHPDAGAVPGRGGQRPSRGRGVFRRDSAGVALLRRLHRSGRRGAHPPRAGHVRAQQRARGGAAGVDLRGTGLLRPLGPARIRAPTRAFSTGIPARSSPAFTSPPGRWGRGFRWRRASR